MKKSLPKKQTGGSSKTKVDNLKYKLYRATDYPAKKIREDASKGTTKPSAKVGETKTRTKTERTYRQPIEYSLRLKTPPLHTKFNDALRLKQLATKQTGGPSTPKRTTLPKKQYAVNTDAGAVPTSKVKTPSNKTIRKIDKSLKPVVQKSRSSSVKSPAPKRRKF